MFFGERLKQRREEMSLTQEDVCSYFSGNLSRQAISKWERDEAYPEVNKLLLLSVKLDISLDDLFSDELENLRSNKASSFAIERYPGLITGIKTFAEALKKLNL